MKLKVTALAIVAVFCLGAGTAANQAPAVVAKKKCRIVKKRVHGKIRKVRVCTKAKPTVTKVAIKLDQDRAVSSAIAATEGGTITATSSSGTKLTLTIPKDALVEGATVTVTPVASVTGLPKGARFFGGVQLAPEGTSLLKSATLTVEPAGAASAKHLHAIAWTGTGKNPVSYGATRSGAALEVKVLHFSGAGVGDWVEWDSGNAYWDELHNRYARIHAQLVQATTTDSVAVSRKALGDWVAWEHELQEKNAIFLADKRKELREKLVPRVVRNMIEKSYERCKERHDVADEVLFLTGLQRQVQLLGLNDLNALIEQDRGKCATFELDFESVITGVAGGGDATAGARVHALKLSFANDYENEAPLDYYRFEWLPEVQGDCAITTVTRGDEPFRAKLSSVGEGDDPPGLNVGPPTIVMHVFGGTTTETVTMTCPNSAPLTVTLPFWGGMFLAFHHGDSAPYSFTINDWDYVGTSLFARKTYSQSISVEGGTLTEQTTFDLRHTPE